MNKNLDKLKREVQRVRRNDRGSPAAAHHMSRAAVRCSRLLGIAK
jgi:hypothetical protein